MSPVPLSINKYIIDSNILITPNNLYYPFDMVPFFWNWMEKEINSEKVIIIDHVKDEICRESKQEKKDILQRWLENVLQNTPSFSYDDNTMSHYAEIIKFLYSCPAYANNSFKNWADYSKADPFLIASARSFNAILVTNEGTRFKNDSEQVNFTGRPMTSEPKIPDVCNHFNVKYMNIFEFLRNEHFVIK